MTLPEIRANHFVASRALGHSRLLQGQLGGCGHASDSNSHATFCWSEALQGTSSKIYSACSLGPVSHLTDGSHALRAGGSRLKIVGLSPFRPAPHETRSKRSTPLAALKALQPSCRDLVGPLLGDLLLARKEAQTLPPRMPHRSLSPDSTPSSIPRGKPEQTFAARTPSPLPVPWPTARACRVLLPHTHVTHKPCSHVSCSCGSSRPWASSRTP